MFVILEAFTSKNVLRGLPRHLKKSHNKIDHISPLICAVRGYADVPKSDSKKIVVKVQGTETEQRVRVRLARSSDVPRVLKFVRDHARVWPGPLTPPSNLIVGDYVARILAQGHSMLAEHPVSPRSILGLALAAALCPWDADVLERWARCVRCARAQRLLNFTAHCLRAPKLNEPSHMLHTILIVPPDTPRSAEIVRVLAKNTIRRGKEAGFPLVRFDVTKDSVVKVMEEMKLKKEWFVTYKFTNVGQPEDFETNTQKESTEVGDIKNSINESKMTADVTEIKEFKNDSKMTSKSNDVKNLKNDSNSKMDISKDETSKVSEQFVSVYTAQTGLKIFSK